MGRNIVLAALVGLAFVLGLAAAPAWADDSQSGSAATTAAEVGAPAVAVSETANVIVRASAADPATVSSIAAAPKVDLGFAAGNTANAASRDDVEVAGVTLERKTTQAMSSALVIAALLGLCLIGAGSAGLRHSAAIRAAQP
jgi:hypothetical protein